MKKSPRRAVSLLLLVLFSAGLLAVPASADEVPEDLEHTLWWMMDLLDGGGLPDLYGQQVDSLTCDHPKAFPAICSYTAKDSDEHYMVEFRLIHCPECEMFALLRKEPSTGPHIYYPERQYLDSDHSGPCADHTHSYQYTCCCGHVEIAAVPAGCTSGGCTGPSDDDPPADLPTAVRLDG